MFTKEPFFSKIGRFSIYSLLKLVTLTLILSERTRESTQVILLKLRSLALIFPTASTIPTASGLKMRDVFY